MTDITNTGCEKKSAVALGFFDGLHLGHIEVIKRIIMKPGFSSVVFTFNDKTMLPKFKERKNIISYELKLNFLADINIDYIFAPDFSEIKDLSPEEFVDRILIDRLSAKFVCCGYDFRFAKGGMADSQTLSHICADRGIEACVVPAVMIDGEPISSTAIRRLIQNGNIPEANRLLGYELTYFEEVVRGKQNGRRIGFPTINQRIQKGMTLPRLGVYKSWTQIGSYDYPSITNIGFKPTIDILDGESRILEMETHIIGFSGELYGKKIKVVLREFMREERRFKNLEELAKQLENDKAEALKRTQLLI